MAKVCYHASAFKMLNNLYDYVFTLLFFMFTHLYSMLNYDFNHTGIYYQDDDCVGYCENDPVRCISCSFPQASGILFVSLFNH